MIIRSQNKTSIINLDNVDTISVESGEIFYYNGTQESRGLLGGYSTKEKAVKVLDLICETYEVFCAGNAYEQSVFNMPQDSKV